MRAIPVKTATAVNWYIVEDIKSDGKRSTKTIKKLGSEDSIMKQNNLTSDADFKQWLAQMVAECDPEKRASYSNISLSFSQDRRIMPDQQRSVSTGYLFLQKIFHGLSLDLICRKIDRQHRFGFDLAPVLAHMLYSRILDPSSYRSAYDFAKTLPEPPEYQQHQMYRALSELSAHFYDIQAEVYRYSKEYIDRKTGVLYYDVTNFFFEIEQEEDDKEYGAGKEHRPNPIIQMGLMMDYSGLPLAITVFNGSGNEQPSLIPLEQKIMDEFPLSKFIICTDAGLCSEANKQFNNVKHKRFITTHPVKKMDKELKEWALNPDGWRLEGEAPGPDGKPILHNIAEIEDTPENLEKLFYKENWIPGYDEERDVPFDQTITVTFSLKYRNYQRMVRNRQIERAQKLLESNPRKTDRKKATDFKRLVKKTTVTKEGEIATQDVYTLNHELILEEERYDGFYGLATNLKDDISTILRVARGRWEIEESFRIMKTDFLARPVYVKRRDRIRAHFLVCFLALLFYRILEHKLDEKYTVSQILNTLRGMQMSIFQSDNSNVYVPSYTRTQLTDDLHRWAGFETDREIITQRSMSGIIRKSKERNTAQSRNK